MAVIRNLYNIYQTVICIRNDKFNVRHLLLIIISLAIETFVKIYFFSIILLLEKNY